MSEETATQVPLQHTPEPWWFEDDEHTWQLFGGSFFQKVTVDGQTFEVPSHPLQILKAPKRDTPYAEYWPKAADGHRLVAAVNACAGVSADQLEPGFLRRVLDLNTRQVQRMIHLTTLALGCSKHPSYRAKRKITTLCNTCDRMWIASQALKERLAMADLDELKPGPELDEMVCEAIGIAPTLRWWLSNNGGESGYYQGTRGECEDYLADMKRRNPNYWTANGEVISIKQYPRVSEDIAAAWRVVKEMVKHIGYDEGPADPWRHFEWNGPLYKPEHRYLTAEGYPLGTMCWYVYVECSGFQKRICADTPELAICRAAIWVMDKVAQRIRELGIDPKEESNG